LVAALALCAAAAPKVALAAAPDAAPCTKLALSPCPQPYDAQLPPAAEMLTWTQDQRVVGFRNGYRLYEGDVFHAGVRAYPLPVATASLSELRYHMDGRELTLDDYLARQNVTGLLVLKDGKIIYEYYGHGNTERTLWTSRSVAKSVVSVLMGIAVREGKISLDDPVTRYMPELLHSAWDGVRLRNLLQHTSGVAWNENYQDPESDFAKLTRCEATPAPYPCILALLTSLQRKPGVLPGEVWSYNTGGAWLVGRSLERATKTTIAKYLETRLWSRFAMESNGVWQALDPGHIDMGGHGFNATLRDWGRFASFVENGGHLPGGTQILPDDWLAQSRNWTRARGSVTPSSPDGAFGYQWWHSTIRPSLAASEGISRIADESFWALGIFGQAIAIDPVEHLILVQWSTWKEAEKPDSLYDEQVLLFGALGRSLHGATSAALMK
jgi:CubicO group peptidase (beta-lactamase class C family)